MGSLSIAKWVNCAGLKETQLMSQVTVAMQESIEITEAILEKSPQEIVDGVVDVDWMVNVIETLQTDQTKAAVGLLNLRDDLNKLIELIDTHYPLLLDQYFDNYKQAVLESNFSKFAKTEKEAHDTVSRYKGMGVDVGFEIVSGLYVFRSMRDQTGNDGKFYNKGKILKSINYKEPQILVDYKNPLHNRRLTQDDLDDLIKDVGFIEVEETTTTICVITLQNNVVLIGKSACINPDDYKTDLGRKYSYEDAIEKLWELENYRHSALI